MYIVEYSNRFFTFCIFFFTETARKDGDRERFLVTLLTRLAFNRLPARLEGPSVVIYDRRFVRFTCAFPPFNIPVFLAFPLFNTLTHRKMDVYCEMNIHVYIQDDNQEVAEIKIAVILQRVDRMK